MLTGISVYNENDIANGSGSLQIVVGAGAGSFFLRNATGLGPQQREIATTDVSSGEGAVYTRSTRGPRNIVLTIEIRPSSWSADIVGTLKRQLFSKFIAGGTVRLHFSSTHRENVLIQGYVESVQNDMFSKESLVQVSIICPGPFPDFRGFVENTVSSTAGASAVSVPYIGTVPTPLTFYMTSNGSLAGGFYLRQFRTNFPQRYFRVTASFVNGEIIQANTGFNSKQVWKSTNTSLVQYLSTDSEWLTIPPGNAITMQVTASINGSPWYIKYYNRYGEI